MDIFFWIKNICYMLHIASYHCYLIFYWNALISFYQDYFNMSCHWHMNMCYLIGLHVHTLILLKKSLTKEQLNAKCEYGKMLWHSSCEKTTIEWLSFHTIHGTQFPFFLFQFIFLVLWMINFTNLCDFLNYVNIMWELFVQNAWGSKWQACNEYNNDWMKMSFKYSRTCLS
jgi:hypothetical protein